MADTKKYLLTITEHDAAGSGIFKMTLARDPDGANTAILGTGNDVLLTQRKELGRALDAAARVMLNDRAAGN